MSAEAVQRFMFALEPTPRHSFVQSADARRSLASGEMGGPGSPPYTAPTAYDLSEDRGGLPLPDGPTGIADTEKDGMAANAQAAKPINTKRFIWTSPWMAAGSGGTEQCHCVVPGAAKMHAPAALRVHGSDSCN
jgi:hypothetical protein